MPAAGFTVREFVRALNERQLRITKLLDQVFANPAVYRDHPYFTRYKKAGALRGPVPSRIKAELRRFGLGARDINHINRWPDRQKELVRTALIGAVESGRRVRFFWELHPGNSEDLIVGDSGKGTITLTFRSPQRNVKVSTAEASFGQIFVDVAPRAKRPAASGRPPTRKPKTGKSATRKPRAR